MECEHCIYLMLSFVSCGLPEEGPYRQKRCTFKWKLCAGEGFTN